MSLELQTREAFAPVAAVHASPLSGAIYQNLVTRTASNAAMERMSPLALRATSEQLAVVHAALRGRLGGLCGPRGERYFCEQVLGKRPMPLEDYNRLLEQAPDVAASIEPSARLAQRTVMMLLSTSGGSLPRALAAASGAFGALQACALRALEDGVVEPHEADEVLHALFPVLHALHDVRAVAVEHAR